MSHADFALRHLIYTVCKLPETARTELCVTISEPDIHHFARTLFALIILAQDDNVCFEFKAETIIFLCYSQRMPNNVWRYIQRVVGGYLRKANREVASSLKEGGKRVALYSMTNFRLSVNAECTQWLLLNQLLIPPQSLSALNCKAITNAEIKANTHSLGVQRSRMTKSRFMGYMRWRQSGLVMPWANNTMDCPKLNP